jgi:Xaa-Pro aminopeptidase
MAIFGRALSLLLALACAAAAAEGEPWDVFQARRRQLSAQHPGPIVLFGYNEHEGLATRSAFRQENNFYYLTGCNEPDAALLLLPPAGEAAYQEILFLPRRDARRERWTGPRIGPPDADVLSKTGFAEVRDRDDFRAAVLRILEDKQRVHALLPDTPSYGHLPAPDAEELLKAIDQKITVADVRPSLARMRLVKSEGEIRLIQKAVDATTQAHQTVWRSIRPGLFEHQVAATMLATLFDRGSERPAYSPIVGAGANAVVLHYVENAARLREGDLVLMDVGGEYGGYAADITRTVPVSGRFSERQREIYESVLGAQKAAIAAVKPGMRLGGHGPNSLTGIAKEYLQSQGKDQAGNSLSPYFFHLVGHQAGLEVHDPGDPDIELQPGMVITIEPGVYLPEEGIGIRIEDMVLVTEQGSRVLSASLPREAAQIEQRMQGVASRNSLGEKK